MSTPPFTPGPWKVFHTKDGRALLGVGDKVGVGITDCGDVADNDLGLWRSGEEKEANARLIAAAPDLYEALEAVQTLAEGSGPFEIAALNRKVVAALAKARGEQQ